MGKTQQKVASNAATSQEGQGAAIRERALQQQDTAIGKVQGDVNKTLTVNPYEDAGYKSRVRMLSSDALNANENAVDETLNNYSTRSGTNSANIAATAKELGRQRGRDLTDYLAGTEVSDYGKWQDQRTKALGIESGIPSQYNPQIASGTTLQTTGLATQSDLGKQPGFWSTFGNYLAQNAASAGSMAAAG